MLSEASFFGREQPVQGLTRVREIQARLSELLPGQRFEATLQRALPDGTFQAVVAGRTYTLALNHAAKPGDTLELVVTRTSGQTIFAQAANTPVAAGSTSVPTLSSTGRLISFLLTGQPTPQPAALAAGRPLLTQAPPPGSGAQFAPILRQALTQSGLFYESHQAKWLSGKVDINSLKQEPQGQPLPAGATARTPSGGAATMNQMAALLAGQANSAAARETLMQPLARVTAGSGQPAGEAKSAAETISPSPRTNATPASAPPVAASSTSTRAAPSPASPVAANMAGEEESDGVRIADATRQQTFSARAPSMPERLMPIVHQQLEALGTHTYAWQGQAWPGQSLQWEIEDPDDEGETEQAEKRWNTTLRLTMPRLGGIEARLQLSAAGVTLRLLADDAAAVAALEAAGSRLDSALAAQELPLIGFSAERRDER